MPIEVKPNTIIAPTHNRDTIPAPGLIPVANIIVNPVTTTVTIGPIATEQMSPNESSAESITTANIPTKVATPTTEKNASFEFPVLFISMKYVTASIKRTMNTAIACFFILLLFNCEYFNDLYYQI